jgi:predicted nucleotidyltransferase
MHSAVASHLEGIAAICRQYGIRRLGVFGSAARASDFEADRSDVDFLLEFEPDARPDLETYFSAKAALERLLGREVDLVELGALRNPFLRREIERQRETVYES